MTNYVSILYQNDYVYYTGDLNDHGQPHGRGVIYKPKKMKSKKIHDEFFMNPSMIYIFLTGNFKNGKPHGKNIYQYDTHKKLFYKGEYEEGKISGRGIFFSPYDGYPTFTGKTYAKTSLADGPSIFFCDEKYLVLDGYKGVYTSEFYKGFIKYDEFGQKRHNGFGVTYYNNGQIKHIGVYKNGIIADCENTTVFDQSGKITYNGKVQYGKVRLRNGHSMNVY